MHHSAIDFRNDQRYLSFDYSDFYGFNLEIKAK
jgi:hypothetical protein